MRKRGEILVIFLVGILVILGYCGVVSATYKVDKNSSYISETYAAGAVIGGQLNISFSSQGNDEFSGSLGNEKIAILDILNKSGYGRNNHYSCSPLSCRDAFSRLSTDPGSIEVSVVLDRNLDYGLIITTSKTISEISSFQMNITSDAGQSCTSQLAIDFLGDGIIDFYNSAATSDSCGEKSYGLFDSGGTISSQLMSKEGVYCQRVSVAPAPAYTLGANITRESATGSSNDDIGFYMYPLEGGSPFTGQGCFPDTSHWFGVGATNFVEVSCVINYTFLVEREVYICVGAKRSSTVGYRLVKEEGADENGGFFSDDPAVPESEDKNYEIYAQAMKYNRMKDVSVGSEGTNSLIRNISDYVTEIYAGNCSRGCVVPFTLIPGTGITNQKVNLTNGKIVGKQPNKDIVDDRNFYEIHKEPVKITSKQLILDIGKMGFKVPKTEGNQTFKLFLGGDSAPLIEKKIHVEIGFDYDLSPRFSFIGQRINFVLESGSNITRASWNFGDGSQQISSEGRSIEHVYTKQGLYTIQTTAIASTGESSLKTFSVLVGEPKASANYSITDLRKRLNTTKQNIASYSEKYVRDKLSILLGIEEAEAQLKKQSDKFNGLLSSTSAKDEDYIAIVTELMKLNIPSSVKTMKEENLPADVGYLNIDTAYIEEASGKAIVNREAFKNNLQAWMMSNYEIDLSAKTISSINVGTPQVLMKAYKITLKKIGSNPGPSTLIIEQPLSSTNLKFKESYGEREIKKAGGTYINLNDQGNPSTIEFLIVGNNAPNIDKLGVYISPPPAPLDLSMEIGTIVRPEFYWARFLIWGSILIVIFFVIYIILQEWYKRHYEKSLFKNPDDLYNLLNFIYNSRAAGLSDDATKNKLYDRKWKKEQVAYAFKKIDGKRTGMWEIPLFKLMEKNKVKRQIELKQGRPVDPRMFGQQWKTIQPRNINFIKRM